jgi:hypothetical protein
MARPLKNGLDYYPMDVDFFEDDKIQFVSSRFDEKGELVAVKLLCKIFKQGYFIQWNEDVALLFAKGAGKNISPSLANDVVNELIKRDFFHKGLFERFSILTSNGIQKRYEHICIVGRRKNHKIEPKYDIRRFTPDETRLMKEETELTPEQLPQSKGKKKKVKESKVERGAHAPPQKSFKEFTERDFIEQIGLFKDQFSYEIRNGFFRYWKEKSPGGKMRFQLEKTWETELRLEKWLEKNQTFSKNGQPKQTPSASGAKPGRSQINDTARANY